MQEKARLRRQLEEKLEVTETVLVEDVVSLDETATTAVPRTHDNGGQHDHANTDNHGNSGNEGTGSNPQPVPINADIHTEKPHASKNEKIRHMLVNNYRPVQPLNGRVVYRSFPFFDEPITSDTEVLYVEKSVSDDKTGSASAVVMSFCTMICSILLTRLF